MDDWIHIVLYITGGITALPLAFYFAPKFVLKNFMGLSIEGEASLTIVRHWGLLIALIGFLLIWAGADPALRVAAITLAIIEKAGMILWLIYHRKTSWVKGFWLSVVFDVGCIGLFLAWILTEKI